MVRRTTPERGQSGAFCLYMPLQAPRSPNTYSRCVQQYQYESYSSTCVGTEFALVSCRDVQHSTCVGTPEVQCWDFHFFSILRHPGGASDPSPGNPLDDPRSARWSSKPVPSSSPQRAAVWGGRGAMARPREATWSSGVAAVFWACYNENIFKDPNDYHDVTSALYLTSGRLNYASAGPVQREKK